MCMAKQKVDNLLRDFKDISPLNTFDNLWILSMHSNRHFYNR